MKRKNFIFTNKRHSNKAIMATILGAISVISLGTAFFLSYLRGGENVEAYGTSCLFITIFALIGLVLGGISMTEKDRYKLFSWLGVVLNFLALAGISALLYAGAYL